MKKCIVTGAAGFTGCNLVERLLAAGYFVYCVVRENSAHNKRLENLVNVQLVYADLAEYKNLYQQIQEPCEIFFHLAWQGGRYDFAAQYQNVEDTLGALEAAKKIGCKRFVCTGSQAEYGPHQDLITEETCPHPIDAYGSAKLAACILTRQRAMDMGTDFQPLWKIRASRENAARAGCLLAGRERLLYAVRWPAELGLSQCYRWCRSIDSFRRKRKKWRDLQYRQRETQAIEGVYRRYSKSYQQRGKGSLY